MRRDNSIPLSCDSLTCSNGVGTASVVYFGGPTNEWLPRLSPGLGARSVSIVHLTNVYNSTTNDRRFPQIPMVDDLKQLCDLVGLHLVVYNRLSSAKTDLRGLVHRHPRHESHMTPANCHNPDSPTGMLGRSSYDLASPFFLVFRHRSVGRWYIPPIP